MNKWFWIILVVAVAGLIGIFVIAGNKDSQNTTTSNQASTEISDQDHIRGNPSAKVTFLEYGDFQCPACAAFHPLLKQAEQEYGSKVQFVFRNFPLSNIHPNAFSASRAAEAASAQGKFWQMHDILYERQSEWEKDTNAAEKFRSYAQELGLDANQFDQDYSSNGTSEQINADIKSGQGLQVSGTPTFFINGQKVELNRDYQALKAKLEEALKANP